MRNVSATDLNKGHPRLDAEALATTLRVLGMLPELAPDDPDIQAVKRAAAVMTSRIRQARRREARTAARAPGLAHDRRVLESTATGSPLRIAAAGWHAPLDLVDGAARVYGPIVRGEAGQDLYGGFLKDFSPHPW